MGHFWLILQRAASDNLTPNRSNVGTNCCYSKADPKTLLPYLTITTLKQVLIIIAMCRVPVYASEYLLKVNNKNQRLLTKQNTGRYIYVKLKSDFYA